MIELTLSHMHPYLALARVQSCINWRFISLLLAICSVSAFFPPRDIGYIDPQLDGTWKFAINAAHSAGWEFGRDIFITYGPLGFLAATVGINYHIQITIIVAIALFALQIFLFYRLIKRSTSNIFGIFQFLLLCLLSWSIARLHFENNVQFTTLLALLAAWDEEEEQACFLLACVLTALAMFVKFTAAISCGSAIAVYWGYFLILKQKTWKRIWWMPALIPIIFGFGYLLYSFSFTSLYQYIRGAMETSSGYISAMSFPVPWWTPSIYYVVIFYIPLALGIILSRSAYAYYPVILIGPVFVALKHGLVRADMWHFDMAVGALLPLFGLLLLIFPINNLLKCCLRFWYVTFPLFVCVVGITYFCPPVRLYLSGQRSVFEKYIQFADFQLESRSGAITSLKDKIIHPFNGEVPIPAIYLQAIGSNSVSIYPTFLVWGAYHNLNLKAFPTVQAYAAYTPFLDEITASFFKDKPHAPQYLLFDISSIDGRWPLIEAPLAWDAIYRNYEPVLSETNSLLLQQRNIPLDHTLILVETGKIDAREMLILPDSKEPLYIQADFLSNLKGKAAKVFSKIPEVFLTATFSDGQIQTGRCIQANMSSPTLISFLPRTLEETEAFISSGRITSPVSQISFSGPGMEYYKPQIPYKIFKSIEIRPDRQGK